MFVVRPMLPADAELVVAMHEAPVRDGYVMSAVADRVVKRLAEPTNVDRVLEVDGRAVGMLALRFEADWLVEFQRIIVSEPGKGYGRAAVEWVKRFTFVESRAHRVYLDVVARNARARRLYESCGFVLEGTWRDGFRDPSGAYWDLCAYGMLERDYRDLSR